MPELIMLVGLPASGKSTWRNQFDTSDYVVASTDDYIEAAAIKHGLTYDQAFANYIDEASEHLNRQIKQAVENNQSIIWDQTNLTVRSRKQKLSRIPEHYNKIAVAVVCKSYEEYNKRLNSRPGKTITQTVIDSMARSFQKPTTDEGFNFVYVIEN